MRVALMSYNATAASAVGNQILEKVLAFVEIGAEVRVFLQSAEPSHSELKPFVCHVPMVESTGPIWDYLSQADLVIAVYAQAYDLLQYLPMLDGGRPRLLLHYHGVTPAHLWSKTPSEFLEKSLRQRGFAWCVDHVLADSQWTRRELLEDLSFPAEHLSTLPLCVETERFQSEPRGRFLQDRLRLLADAKVMLYVGRLAPNKRVPLLVDVLKRMSTKLDLHAVILGDDRDVYSETASQCRELARQMQVADRLHILGQVSDSELVQAYRCADVLVLPSLHEGFCVPVLEAMASGLPVIASRSAALPETIADAGLTFSPNDSADLSTQVARVLQGAKTEPRSPRNRVAIVSFRFGTEIVGGAETSLRTLALTLQQAGTNVDIFTTCTQSECVWQNELPPGTTTLDGLKVHRFRIDAHDRQAHHESFAQILEANGNVAAEQEHRYLAHSLHSAALMRALRERRAEFDAILVGPYLFGLTADVAQSFPEQTIVIPCFHDEPLARLAIWPTLYRNAAGILYHSPEEQEFAQTQLGVNHPNSGQLGTWLDIKRAEPAPSPRPYVVYCGRFSEQKNVPILLEWAAHYQSQHPNTLDFVFVGQGEMTLPQAPWLRVLGRVDESTKREILAGAVALVQLSQHESLSIVVLESWAQARPVIVSKKCAVLAKQIERAQAGIACDDDASFVQALDQLVQRPEFARQLGEQGRSYVEKIYGDREAYLSRVRAMIENIKLPLAERMRQRGFERAAECDRSRWRDRFIGLVEHILEEPARTHRDDLGIQPCQPEIQVAWGNRTALVPVRLFNWGSHAVVAEGPGRHTLAYEISDLATGRIVVPRLHSELAAILLPGQSQTTVLPLTLPAQPGRYRLTIWPQYERTTKARASHRMQIPLLVEARGSSDSCTTGILDQVQRALTEADRLGRLPNDYVDVSTGTLGQIKLKMKQKLLNNFKHKYVDVMSRQQSQVNQQLVLAVQQLSECCSSFGQVVRGLQQRIDQLEAKLARSDDESAPIDADPIYSEGESA